MATGERIGDQIWYPLENRFPISDPTGTATLYTAANGGGQSMPADPNETYTVYSYSMPDFTNVRVQDSQGNIYYVDYDQFEANKDSDDSKFRDECWSKINEFNNAQEEYRNQVYQEQYGYMSSASLIDDEGDQIVGPLKEGGSMGKDMYMSAIVKTYGMPPQWTKYVDPRTYAFELNFKESGVTSSKCALGRRFIDVTISRPTIIEIAPGRVYYPTAGLGSKEDYASALDAFDLAAGGDISNIVNDDKASFFTIRPCYTDSPDKKIHGYISYVSVLMRVFAAFLSRNNKQRKENITRYYNRSAVSLNDWDPRTGLQFADRPVPIFGAKYREFTWAQYDGEGTYTSGLITGNFAALDDNGQHGVIDVNENTINEDGFTYIRFFGLNGTRSSDTFDTQIDDTQIASTVNGITGGVKDAAFFISGVIGDKFAKDLDDAEDKLKEFANGDGEGGMLSALLDSTAEIIRGGKVVFPKIISDCDYGKSMSIECIFTAVYGDPESIYLNTYAGLAHILAFALPHQVRSSIEIYTYPFIIKAFSKGIFSCSMGVLSGLTVDYAGESGDMWSIDSVPSEIKVSFQITPLISKLALTSENDSAGWLLRNNGLQEYIATIAGSDLRSDKVELATELAGIMLQGMPAKLETGAWQRLKEWFYASTLGNVYRNLSYAWNDGTTLNDLINNIL